MLTQKNAPINYINFRIKQVKKIFYKGNKIANFLVSLIKWGNYNKFERGNL